jgi:transposase-like protein
MTVDRGFTSVQEALEVLGSSGFDGMAQAMEILLNAAMRAERERYLGASAYERSDDRKSYANGFKPKSVKTRLGELALSVPQTRDSGFYPSSLTRGLRSERAITMALAEMYVQGVATRRVKDIVEDMCGFDVSSSTVSRCAKELDSSLEAWRNRKLGSFPFLLVDAMYIKVREDGLVRDMALLSAMGIDLSGKKHVLGVCLGLSEAEVNWRRFLESLISRGLTGIKMVISDDHSGLGAARMAVLPSVPWQRCQFHLQRNAQSYITKAELKGEVAADLRAIFNARDEAESKRLLAETVAKYSKTQQKLSVWMETNVAEGLTVFRLEKSLRRRLRTTNAIERLNGEIRRRVKVIASFPNSDSCLRLATAVAMEVSEDWENGRRYVRIEN